jgi:hypothetical protein
MVRAVVSAAQAIRLPPVLASKMPAQPIDPQLPPLAAANSMAAAFVALVGLVPEIVIVQVATRA